MFADDAQLHIHCGRENTALTIVRLEYCIMDVNYWMSANRLKANRDKTGLIWTGTKYSVTALFPVSEAWRGCYSTKEALAISADLGLEKHVSNVSATCFHHLRQV